MIVIMAVRGYSMVGRRCDIDFRFFSYSDACKHAAILSEFKGPINIQRDPLIRDDEEIEGEQTVARFINGKKVFPI